MDLQNAMMSFLRMLTEETRGAGDSHRIAAAVKDHDLVVVGHINDVRLMEHTITKMNKSVDVKTVTVVTLERVMERASERHFENVYFDKEAWHMLMADAVSNAFGVIKHLEDRARSAREKVDTGMTYKFGYVDY